ncbi:non-ribosomal peptide synthetase [Leptothoe kymatousa]|uniref:Amino acid adenylation domain-containing protein n=1 Tax=Leptothoe kymatousa TAU-MAC 1615 TaxID=2364775 RepID=A0ABS5Y4M2_9CYAN|nr:non-ribosomal peptide synthetase [Leptothoe kymatousa]MBT9312777.1 amino acid adenylation domain-containing protein [Leptothoe kymatousa TAU-MAC 1615]
MTHEESPQSKSIDTLAARLARLSPQKRMLLEKKLRQQASQQAKQVTTTGVISHVSDRDSAPLSFSQQRLWFVEQLEPDANAYHIPTALRLVGDLNINSLKQTLNAIIKRHDSLRTVFPIVNGNPVQIVKEVTSLELPIVDATDWPNTERENKVQYFLNEQAHQPFDLTSDPLLRGSLLKLAENEYILLLVLHHIASDAWSKGILKHELSVLYSAFVEGKPSPLSPLPIQYLDFACWQQKWLTGDVLETQVKYWQQALSGAPALLNLPTDRPRPAVQTYTGSRQRFYVDQTITRALRALSQSAGATLYMTLLAALSVLLSRYSGQEEIMVGSPIANRNLQETESLIGFFANTLVMRSRLQGNPSFIELLERVRKTALGAYAHKDIPFEHLVSELKPERDQSHSLWFQVFFALQNVPHETLDLKGLSVSTVQLEAQTAKFDLTFGVYEIDSGLRGVVSYNTDLFDAATIQRMVDHFQVLLAAIVENPNQHILELPIITVQEKEQLLNHWSSRYQVSNLQPKLLHQLFKQQVDKFPEQTAVIYHNPINPGVQQSLTYQELNCRANQLAHYLKKMGVGPDVLVGLCLERSVEMVVGLLAVLKAGGAYVPLDPHYPKERLAFMLSDAQISVLLTQTNCLSTLPELTVQTVYFDQDWDEIAQESAQPPKIATTLENLAYVIYTSGSTGMPKGVMVQHNSIVNFTQAALTDYGTTTTDRILQFASISFDAAAEEIYPCLAAGGTLVLRTEDMLSSVDQFLQTCRDWQLTVLDLPTAYWQQIVVELAAGNVTLPETLRLVIIGGERVSPESVKLWQSNVSDFPRLINTYGPTEGTVVATAYPIETTTNIQQEVPIGKAISNVQTYVLDQQLQPVPIGVPGELYIGGTCLARGYLNRPELTTERFIANPFRHDSQVRLYKTGDLVRYLPDGNLEYLGRLDDQVKIRGFRIELGAVETVLVRHPGLEEAVVIACPDTLGNQQLVAYVVSKDNTPTVSDLRAFPKKSLPEYMVPSVFISLDSLPLTPSGKVDRRALPKPDLNQRNLENDFVAPRNPVEETLSEIWRETLKAEKIGVRDNFFELGGHSLLATQIISRIRQIFQLELPLRRIFEAPSIESLAEQINLVQDGHSDILPSAIVPIERETRQITPGTLTIPTNNHHRNQGENVWVFPTSFAQQRLWFVCELKGSQPNYTATWKLEGVLQIEALEQALSELVRRHEILRTTFTAMDGLPMQVISSPIPVTLPIIDLQGLSAAEQTNQLEQLMLEKTRQSFDLSRGPLMQAILICLGPTSHVLFLRLHHITYDGWSLGTLRHELSILYQAFVRDEPSPLSELPIQYADFAVWQRQWLKGKILEVQLNYWQQQLAGAPALLELPTDYPRPAIQSFKGGGIHFNLGQALTKKLKHLSQESGTTLFMTLLAAFQVLLSRYSGQDDIVVGSPVANRNHRETESLIGFFLNMLVLRTQLQGNPDFHEVLNRVRQVALGAYAHQDIPFEELVSLLKPERSLSYSPWFQVMFVFQNLPSGKWDLPELTVTPLKLKRDQRNVMFDLTLIMHETNDGLAGRLLYKTELFEQDTISRMAGHFQTLLEAVVTNPDQLIADLPLLNQTEQYQLLTEWNPIPRVSVPAKCIHQLFELQAERTPDAIAVVHGEQCIAYSELNTRANQLARYLQTLDIGPDSLVGLCVGRSIEMLVGMLGILKAGGAYVPLDPHYPKDRLAFMLSDAQTSVLLTQEQWLSSFPEISVPTICLDRDWKVIAQENAQNLISETTPAHLAYVIYTSGSTGTPKGVMVQHDSIVNFTQAAVADYETAMGDRILQFASISFDAAAEEIYPCLTTGATLVLRTDEMLGSIEQFLKTCQDWELTVLDLPTAYWQQVVTELVADRVTLPEPLRLIIIGGERVSPESVKTWQTQIGDYPRLINTYGPTEGTVVATAYPIGANVTIRQEVPIGKAITNIQTYVLDQQLQPVPIGVPGELYIGGACLARGYLNRPELTTERFIANPFRHDSQTRLYKTGDLVRYLPDGNLEYLGRLDDQVKIRGFRIELGAVETVLVRHPGLEEAVVIACPDTLGSQQLVAYVVSKDNTPTVSDLRACLKKTLPEYMVPSVFISLDSLPLTPSGKVDRRALPKPDLNQGNLENDFVAPRNPVEETLSNIWEELLKQEKIGIYDNFFELGGHSLLATQMVSRINENFELNLLLRNIFEAPTIAELGNRITTLLDMQSASNSLSNQAMEEGEL